MARPIELDALVTEAKAKGAASDWAYTVTRSGSNSICTVTHAGITKTFTVTRAQAKANMDLWIDSVQGELRAAEKLVAKALTK